MQKTKIAFGSVLAVTLLFTGIGNAQMDGRGGEMRGGEHVALESLFQDAGLEMPDDWTDMSKEEQMEYMEASGIEMPERPGGMEREKSGEGEQGMRGGQENKGDRMEAIFEEAGVEMPDDWDDMTQEERQEYMEDSGIEMPEREEGEMNRGRQNATQKQVRNLTRKAKKGTNFKKFTGQLKSKKKFNDEDDMENPEAVSFMQQRGIMEGYDDGTFGADKAINRVETLKTLLEALGIDPEEMEDGEFNDVDSDAWYAGYIKAAKRRGFVKGYEDGTFKPGNTVNQAELLKVSFESFGIDLADYAVTSLPDGLDKDAWFAPYLQYALDNELLDGEDVNLGEGMNREMFAEVVSRLIQQQEELAE